MCAHSITIGLLGSVVTPTACNHPTRLSDALLACRVAPATSHAH